MMLLNLERGSMVTVELHRQDCVVQCRSGRLWITVAGDPRDHFLEGNGESLVSGPGRMVIEALDGSCLGMHSESELTVKVNEDYCPTAGPARHGEPRGSKPRAFQRKYLGRQDTLLIPTKTSSV
jgi:hypothetical protein